MREGTIKCRCGQDFYFKTASSAVKCPNPKCGAELDVTEYPVIEEQPKEGDPNGTAD